MSASTSALHRQMTPAHHECFSQNRLCGGTVKARGLTRGDSGSLTVSRGIRGGDLVLELKVSVSRDGTAELHLPGRRIYNCETAYFGISSHAFLKPQSIRVTRICIIWPAWNGQHACRPLVLLFSKCSHVRARASLELDNSSLVEISYLVKTMAETSLHTAVLLARMGPILEKLQYHEKELYVFSHAMNGRSRPRKLN